MIVVIVGQTIVAELPNRGSFNAQSGRVLGFVIFWEISI